MDNQNKRAIALGYFDGLHLGHARVLHYARMQKERGLTPAVLLFDCPPAQAITHQPLPRLLTDEDRDRILRAEGFELLPCVFEEIRALSPEAFVSEILCRRLGAGFVSCGFNYHFGKNGAGDAARLVSLCAAAGIDSHVCDPVLLDGESISSSRIRSCVENGEMLQACRLLGRPLFYSGVVAHGDRRGRTLGFPTANLELPPDFIVPKYGVYASFVYVGGVYHPAVTNIGCRPTFRGASVRSETHILHFDGDLYGQRLGVSLVDFLRPERAFENAAALQECMRRDAEAAERHPFLRALAHEI